ncbi:IclR family transcriptional regulator, partial [Burkholderia pseudomallei]|nr:IclR family transcriptional regulator [Burkholderia pseudomallei]
RRRVSGGRLPRLDARRRADARRPSASPTRVASRLRMSKTPLDRRDWIVGFEKSLAILEAFDTSKAWVAAIDNGSRT